MSKMPKARAVVIDIIKRQVLPRSKKMKERKRQFILSSIQMYEDLEGSPSGINNLEKIYNNYKCRSMIEVAYICKYKLKDKINVFIEVLKVYYKNYGRFWRHTCNEKTHDDQVNYRAHEFEFSNGLYKENQYIHVVEIDIETTGIKEKV